MEDYLLKLIAPIFLVFLTNPSLRLCWWWSIQKSFSRLCLASREREIKILPSNEIWNERENACLSKQQPLWAFTIYLFIFRPRISTSGGARCIIYYARRLINYSAARFCEWVSLSYWNLWTHSRVSAVYLHARNAACVSGSGLLRARGKHNI